MSLLASSHEKLAGMGTIHTAIKERRLSLGMSLQDLAQKVSEIEGLAKPLTWQTVQQWESGKSAPKRARMNATAQALQLNVSALADGRVEPAENPPRLGVTVNSYTLDAQPVSKMVAWEELCMPDLPNVFKLVLQDDSLSPRHSKGDFVELQRDLTPVSGDWVLVQSSKKVHEIREFVDIGAEGWAAAPVNKIGEAITSKSGAYIIGVYIGGGVSKRMSNR